ncbi:PepSY-associated TM region [Maribacter dokdonensis]|uniref:PepSY domain-containing protein n=1 Tax=Maribacter dokdonensis TaxID=320912 RepID=UPI001B0C390D|nr:PepSY domain-containing protein [Maribacter dokdonensis]CAG2533076.1 PepSY-associated TM region [Maribacter dokdonensis]
MVNRKTAKWIRKAHRYLGIFLGIQFLMWTISGMYFSWTDIDEIHGDQFKKQEPKQMVFSDLLGTGQLNSMQPIQSLELLEIAEEPYYWINEAKLYNAKTGEGKEGITKEEAQEVAQRYMLPELKIAAIKRIEEVGNHHEYRGRPLPAYEISYKTDENLKAYVAVENGAFQTVRHRDWRWFDFLWMTHTMDYDTRDNFNTIVLRAFSLLGLITVLSGFLLWYISSPSVRRMKSKSRR